MAAGDSKPQYSKFSPVTVDVKKNLKVARISRGYKMNEAARKLGISRKQLEDVETSRNYGCHLDLEFLFKCLIVYNLTWEQLFPQDMPKSPDAAYYKRPRERQGSSPRKRA